MTTHSMPGSKPPFAGGPRRSPVSAVHLRLCKTASPYSRPAARTPEPSRAVTKPFASCSAQCTRAASGDSNMQVSQRNKLSSCPNCTRQISCKLRQVRPIPSRSKYNTVAGRQTITLPSTESPEGSTMKIVVIGGSGLIGKKLVSRLRERGHEVVPASPSSGVNTLTGQGLSEALAGAQVVVDVANSPSWEDTAVLDF